MPNTKDQVIARLVEEMQALELDELAMWHCYHQHPDDLSAQQACEVKSLAATHALIDELPQLAEGMIAPAIVASPNSDETGIGQSKFGGVPDVAIDFEWPLSDHFTIANASEDYQPVASKSPVPLDRPLPMTFVAQLDLSERALKNTVLPNTGRLLIFMDYPVWFVDEQKAGITLIWDQTPADQLTRATIPEALVWLDSLAIKQWDEFSASLDADFGDTAEHKPFNSGFMPPEIPVELKNSWRRLAPQTIELRQSGYTRRVAVTGAADIYQELGHYDLGQAEQGRPLFHQILSKPFPEQDDPRYDAYYLHLLGRPLLSGADYDAVRAKIGLEGDALKAHEAEHALAFQLLLELDVASFLGMNAEGRFYFFLHQDDLAARNFNAVIVIYQQT